MDLDPVVLLGIAALVGLTVLLTGPGLWSETSGWWMVRDRRRRRPGDKAGRRA